MKKEKRIFLGKSITIEYDRQPIETLENIIREFKKVGTTHFDMYVSRNEDGCIENIEFDAIFIKYESDEEMIERLTKEEKLRKQNLLIKQKEVEELQLATLAILKQKYER